MIKAIIFDFDGTLADTEHILVKVYNRLADKHRAKKLTPAELEEFKFISIKERFRKSGLPFYKLPGMAREAKAIYGEYINTALPFPGIPELLHDLKEKGFILCIVSSNSYANIRIFLKAHDLMLFEKISSTPGLFGKHRSIKNMLKKSGIKKHEAIYVGDELRDIASCKKLSLGMIAVAWGYDPVSVLQGGEPDFLVHKPAEIVPLIEKMEQG